MKICFIRNHPKNDVVTERMIQGNMYSDNISKGFKEMRGIYKFDDYCLFYSFDEVLIDDKRYCFLEHKNIDNNTVEEWMFKNSILQLFTYASFLYENKNKRYDTADFHVKNGNEKLTFVVPVLAKTMFILNFGGSLYSVTITDPKTVVEHYVSKAKSSLSYNTAKEWDALYKYKDFEALKDCFSYKLLTNSLTELQNEFLRKRDRRTHPGKKCHGKEKQSLGTEDESQRLENNSNLKRVYTHLRLRFSRKARANQKRK